MKDSQLSLEETRMTKEALREEREQRTIPSQKYASVLEFEMQPSINKFYKHRNIDCGNCPVGNFCCTLKVKLSLKDRLRIFFHTGMRTKRYADRLFDNSDWGIKLDGDCFFLRRPKDGKPFCSIYKARPGICRKFPHFYEDINDCRDIVKKWRRTIADGVETTEIHLKKK